MACPAWLALLGVLTCQPAQPQWQTLLISGRAILGKPSPDPKIPLILLPSGETLCARLGIGAACMVAAVQAAADRQTDPAPWYGQTYSGAVLIAECAASIPFERYTGLGGGSGTTYACLASNEPDQITPDELATLHRIADQLNGTPAKTLGQFRQADAIERFLAGLAAPRRDPPR